jgi:hypothetical protein
MKNCIVGFDGWQRIFMESFMQKHLSENMKAGDVAALSKFFGILDSTRAQYNARLIERVINSDKLSFDELSQLKNLGAWMGSTDNALGVVYGALGISKKYLYDGNKKKYWESFEKIMKDFEMSKRPELN